MGMIHCCPQAMPSGSCSVAGGSGGVSGGGEVQLVDELVLCAGLA